IGAGNGLKLVLNKETTAFWAVTTEDLIGARSAESAEQSTGLVAPRAVTDLRVAAQVSTGLAASTMSVTLAWTAPGADGTNGALNGVYDIRWSSKTPLTSTSAYVAAQYSVQIVTSGVTPGTSVYYTFPDLDTAATWYFALSALDSQTYPQGVRSGMSNPTTAYSYLEAVLTGGQSADVAWADYDNDGDLDFMAANSNPSPNEVLATNQGGGSFVSAALASGDVSTGLAWGDLDNDGDLDVLLANASGASQRVLRNDGGTFVSVTIANTNGFHGRQADLGDYDNDGDLDGVIGNGGTPGDDWLLINNGGVLSTGSLPTGTDVGAVWGDYDNDGDLDLFLTSFTGPERLLVNTGGSFSVTALGEHGTSHAAWADYDADGDLDVFAGGGVVLRNDGGTFTAVILGASGTAGAWGDFDGDGDLDLALAASPVVVMLNNAGTFSKRILPGTSGMTVNSVAWGDADGDGDLDLVLATSGSLDARVLRNDLDPANPAPSAPTPILGNLALEFDQQGATLTVRWDPGSDGAADTDTIGYQLVMATSPMTVSGDGRRITAPNAFAVPWAYGTPFSGSYLRPAFRTWPGTLVPQHGRQLRLAKTGGTLVNGATYYIRLQAVDAGLARSAWSVELSTFVFASVPAGGRSVSAHLSSMTVTYSTMSSATAYFVEAFSDSGYAALVSSAGTSDLTRTSVTVAGLALNTTYYLRMGTLYSQTTAYASAVPTAAVTLATRPAAAAQAFLDVGISSMVVAWASGGNPAGTRYNVLLSTANPFFGTEPDNKSVSTAPSGGLSAVLTGLKENTSYYLYITPVNHAGVSGQDFASGSSSTFLAAPQAVQFDDVSTTSIRVVAARKVDDDPEAKSWPDTPAWFTGVM
ncbi:hypothetical protein EPO15_00220, partial [bacterium]